jgi:tetratricopeptide (TPR) repeat protein
MMQRNMARMQALQQALAALQAGRFEQAQRLAKPWTDDAAGALLHALGQAGAGDAAGGGATLAAIARANPAARHPVHDLLDLLRRSGRTDEAAPHIRVALDHSPDHPALLGLLGAALAETGPMDEALAAFQRAAEAAPKDAASWSNLGKALAAQGRFDDSEAAFDRAASLAPHDAQLRLNHGVARLKSGRWADGFPLFRARHALPGRAPPPPGPELTRLNDAAGRTVLLLHDEGFGDTIQCIRYAPLLAERGAAVMVQAPPPMTRLLQGMAGVQVVTGRLQQYDAWLRIPDLPWLFSATPTTIPAALPYLSADPALVSAWESRLPARLPGRRRIGLVWAGAGRPHDPGAAATDRLRSIPMERLGPLLAAPGVAWISLQQGRPAPPGVHDPMPGVRDFADTAAIIAGLEMVVSVDTAVTHLAAAMGRPVLLLDRFDHCWRWRPGQQGSAWYPDVLRILRQDRPGNWDDVLRRAVDALHGADNHARPHQDQISP